MERFWDGLSPSFEENFCHVWMTPENLPKIFLSFGIATYSPLVVALYLFDFVEAVLCGASTLGLMRQDTYLPIIDKLCRSEAIGL